LYLQHFCAVDGKNPFHREVPDEKKTRRERARSHYRRQKITNVR
jgi:hypothetical protein